MIAGAPVVCLGEALVDFMPEPQVARLGEARAFTPRFGGSQANTAIGAARLGAPAMLAGCAGTDGWGDWLRAVLEREGVNVSLFEQRADVATTLAFVAVSDEGEPSFSIFGGADAGMLRGRRDALQRIVEAGERGVLAFGSDTLIAPHDRELVKDLKRAATARGWHVLYDPNLRPGRWRSPTEMRGVALGALGHVTVVKANAAEAAALTGEGSPEATAAALVRGGPRCALVTGGAAGAWLAGEGSVVHVPAERARLVDSTGAGDAVAAVAAVALARAGDVTPADVAVAMRVAARVVGARGALDGLPPASEARTLLR